MFSRLGRVPEVGDEIEEHGYQFRVEAVDDSRIDQLVIRRGEGEKEGNGEANGEGEGSEEAKSTAESGTADGDAE